MVGKFHDQEQIDKYLEEWLSPGGSQPDHGLFSEEEKHESTQIEGLSP